MELCTNCSGNGTVNIAGGIKVCYECGGNGEVRSGRDEIKSLRAELAVFRDGVPSSDILHRMASEFPVCEAQQWLRRIAEKVGGG